MIHQSLCRGGAMLLMNPIKAKDAGTAAEYFVQSDGGYYLDGTELRREWGGKAAPAPGT